MITGTSTDYTGRKVDLAMFPSISTSGIRVSADLSSSPKVVAGLSAMAQNFARILLTPRGTFRGDPDMGTYFFDKLSSRSIQYPSDIQQLFLIESGRVLDYMNAVITIDTPLDERIDTVVLTSVDVGTTSIGLKINISSKAGTSIPFLIPVNWTI